MSIQPRSAGGANISAVQMSYREAINAAIEDEMAADNTVVLMGEDVAIEGGVFKTNERLAERFGPQRVLNTPICENTFVGVGLGMAVTGLRPVVEIMFSDFLPSACDAIVNEVAKFRFMSGGQCSVPLTIRSIGGATFRYGSQHSATGESWFMQLPGLKIVTASTPAIAYGGLRAAIRDNNPVLFFEHKGLYARMGPVSRAVDAILPVGKLSVLRQGTDVTLVASLLMADRAVAAAKQLEHEGIDVEVLDITWLRPLDIDAIQASVRKTGRLLVVEEQVHSGGWGATVISELAKQGLSWKAAPSSLSLGQELIMPYSPPLEDVMVPNSDSIADAIKRLHGLPHPRVGTREVSKFEHTSALPDHPGGG